MTWPQQRTPRGYSCLIFPFTPIPSEHKRSPSGSLELRQQAPHGTCNDLGEPNGENLGTTACSLQMSLGEGSLVVANESPTRAPKQWPGVCGVILLLDASHTISHSLLVPPDDPGATTSQASTAMIRICTPNDGALAASRSAGHHLLDQLWACLTDACNGQPQSISNGRLLQKLNL